MTTPQNKPVDLAIVGGGIAGLAAAYYAQSAGQTYTLIEASDQWGGKVITDRVELKDGQFALCERAADGFITRKPWALELAHELDLADQVIPVNATPERIYVLTGGHLAPLPDGLHLLVPTKIAPFLGSPLFSWSGKIRVLMERFIPPRTDDADETLADFIRRRMGREALDKLGEPLLAGVYNAESERQSLLATFPNFRKIEAEHGSLIKGMTKLRQAAPPKRDESGLVSFAGGMSDFVNALVNALTGDCRLNTAALDLQPVDGGYQLTLTDGATVNARRVILATPSMISARLLATIAPDAAGQLNGLRYEGVGSAHMIYRVADIPSPMDAAGVVIPASERRLIDGLQWTTAKWDGRAPDGLAIVRVFFGGPNTRRMLELDEDGLLAVVRDELRSIMGITAHPVAHHVTRWRSAYPQYDLGHRERIAAIESALPAGVKIAGSAYYGVGIPDCIKGAKAAVEIR